MSLIQAMQTEDALTANGAVAHSTSSNELVDLFFDINAMRARTDAEILSKWYPAFAANQSDALRILFYSRDVRGGQGERRVFRVILRDLAEKHPQAVKSNLHLIPEYGRWDDILTVFGTDVESDALGFIRQALVNDKNALCAKWMPREKSAHKSEAVKIRKAIDVSPKEYRKLLSSLTKVVETQMCSKEWDKIAFSHVPSYAMKNYRKAFARHDESRWNEYLSAVESGDAKVNASTLYPHDLVRPFLGYGSPDQERLLNAQWKALPNYMKDNKEVVLPICDVSGSMSGLPMEVCIALGLYISERNEGVFKDAFITFSNDPKMQYVLGNSLSERVQLLRRADWGMSTNLERTFQVILDKAIIHKVSPDKMPTMVLIMSDMQFNSACGRGGGSVTLMKKIREQYADAGYELPKITFWNLNAALTNTPVKFDTKGTALVSGFSPSILNSLLSGGEVTPYTMMRKVIDSERYSAIVG
jgi:hypothetical protein